MSDDCARDLDVHLLGGFAELSSKVVWQRLELGSQMSWQCLGFSRRSEA